MKWLHSINTETASLEGDSAIRSEDAPGHFDSPRGSILKDSTMKMLFLPNRIVDYYILNIF